MKFIRKISCLHIVVSSLLFIGCDAGMYHWPETSGRVFLLNGDKTPLVNSVIIARWEGVGGFTTTTCARADYIRTDSNGRYSFVSWSSPRDYRTLEDRYVYTYTYSPGFKESHREGGDIYLVKRDQGFEDVLNYMVSTIRRFSCRTQDNVKLNKLILEMYDEAVRKASTSKEKKQAEVIMSWVREY